MLQKIFRSKRTLSLFISVLLLLLLVPAMLLVHPVSSVKASGGGCCFTEIRAGKPWSFMPGMNRRSFEWWGRGAGLLSGEADPGGLDCTRECC